MLTLSKCPVFLIKINLKLNLNYNKNTKLMLRKYYFLSFKNSEKKIYHHFLLFAYVFLLLVYEIRTKIFSKYIPTIFKYNFKLYKTEKKPRFFPLNLDTNLKKIV